MDLPDRSDHLRLDQERALVAKARADIAAGRGTEWPAIEAWLHRLDADENAPPPPPMDGEPRE